MNFKKILPHVIAVVIFAALSAFFFSPAVFDGKVLQQPDNQKAGASQTEIMKYYNETGKPVLWTNAFFSGMPTTQIFQITNGNLAKPIFYALLLEQGLTSPFGNVWLAMLMMYILLLVLRVDWRLGIIGAIGFGLSSFNMDIIEAGHSTKMVALAYAPLVLAGAILAFRGRLMIGGAVFGLGLALQIYANHYQITYYTFMILLVMGIAELVSAIKNKTIKTFVPAAAILILGGLLGLGSNLSSVWTTQEYQAETIRGKSELSPSVQPRAQQQESKTADQSHLTNGGLDYKYATDWSYGIGESLTFFAQYANGGGMSQHPDNEAFEKLRTTLIQQYRIPANQAEQQAKGILYTGTQPFLGVSIYMGIIFMFLFAVGVVLIKDSRKWWLVAASFVMVAMVAWGKNSALFDFLFHNMPMFNKFRAITQALGFAQLLFIVLAMLSLQALFDTNIAVSDKKRALYIGSGITVLFCLLALAGGRGANDAQLPAQLMTLVNETRSSLVSSDVMRSLFLMGLSFGLIWLAIGNRLKPLYAVLAIGVLTLFDVWSIGKRILPEDEFKTAQQIKEVGTKASPADNEVLKDKDPHYRVLDLRNGDPFQDATTTAFHKSVGGYHAAQLMRYREVIDKYWRGSQKLLLDSTAIKLYGLVNAKYIIQGDEPKDVLPNKDALGNAWFVKKLILAENADKEFLQLASFDPRNEVIIQKSIADAAKITPPQYDSSATIKLMAYNPDKLDYEYTAKSEQIVVFSEVYYPADKGWKVSLDGQPYDAFVKADYFVRALKVPAGTHKITMSFEPKSYYLGETISLIASAGVLILLVVGLFFMYKKGGFEGNDLLPEEMPVDTAISKPTPKPEEAKAATKGLKPKK